MKPTSEDNWFVSDWGMGMYPSEVRSYVRGQVLEIALRASLHYRIASDDPQRWRIRRHHEYDVNARLESVTRMGTDENDEYLSVINCGELIFTSDYPWDAEFFAQGLYMFSGRISVSVQAHCDHLQNRLPGYARMFNRWQVENIYLPVQDKVLEEHATTDNNERYVAVDQIVIRSWIDDPVFESNEFRFDRCLLECKRVKQTQECAQIGSGQKLQPI